MSLTAYLDPASDQSPNQWTETGGSPPTHHYQCVNYGIRQPTTSGLPGSWYLYYVGASSLTEEFALTASPSDVGTVTDIKAWIYGMAATAGGSARHIDADLYINGGWLGQTDFGVGTSLAWHSVGWTGSWTKEQADAALLKIIGVPTGSNSFENAECYVEITYTSSGAVLAPDNLTQAQALDAATIGQNHVLAAAPLNQAQVLAATTIGQLHLFNPDALWQPQMLASTTILIAGPEINPDDLTQGQTLDAATISQYHLLSANNLAQAQTLGGATIAQVHIFTPAALTQAQHLGTTTILLAGAILSPNNLTQAQTLAAATILQVHHLAPASLVQAQILTVAGVHEQVALSLAIPAPDVRRLSWSAAGAVYIVADGALIARAEAGYLDLGSDVVVRALLLGFTELFDPWPGPLDEVELTITGDPVVNHIMRRPSGGAWAEIAAIQGTAYLDGPLADGSYDYEVIAEDAEGDEATSGTATIIIQAAPAPPTALTYTWVAATKTLTVSWTASSSADVASYRVRSSAGAETLALSGAPVQDTAALTYVKTFTTETGRWIILVRAVDSSGREEQGLSAALMLEFAGGLLVATLAEPDSVYAMPAAGGKIEVGWTYRPWNEDPPGTGAAFEARVYWDAGTGTVDFSAPHATVAMAGPTDEAAYSWTSGVLTAGHEYAFVVRIARAAWPAGTETQNSDQHVTAAPDAALPTRPTLTAEVY